MQITKLNGTRFWAFPLALILLAGCQSLQTSDLYKEGIPGTARWAVLPFVNHTEAEGDVTSQLERVMMVLLPSAGVLNPRLYPESQVTSASLPLTEAHRLQNGKQWAAQNDVSFAISGKLLDWRYDEEGRGHVAVDLMITDPRTGQQLWSASGAGEGLPGEELYDVSRNLFTDLLATIPI